MHWAMHNETEPMALHGSQDPVMKSWGAKGLKGRVLWSRRSLPSAIAIDSNSMNLAFKLKNHDRQQVLRGFEPQSLDSESRVLTVTP